MEYYFVHLMVHKRIARRNKELNAHDIFSYFSKAYALFFNEYFDIRLVMFPYLIIPFIYLII